MKLKGFSVKKKCPALVKNWKLIRILQAIKVCWFIQNLSFTSVIDLALAIQLFVLVVAAADRLSQPSKRLKISLNFFLSAW